MSYRSIATNVDGVEHYKQRYEAEQRKSNLLIGVLIGLVAGLLWEAIRR